MTVARRHILLFATLCLIGAQQAAFVHWVKHLGASAQIVVESPEQHDDAVSLSQFCVVCAAYAALGSALPTAPVLLPQSLAVDGASLLAVISAALPPQRHFDSRAPPVL